MPISSPPVFRQGAVGYSKDPQRRLNTLQTGNSTPLQMLLTIPGTIQSERALHRRFKRDHVNLEWFNYSDDIQRYIAAIAPKYNR